MSRHPLDGSAWVEASGSKVVERVGMGPSLGGWNRNYPYVYKIVFSRLRTSGTYTIAVGGAVSPRFTIAPAASVYATDLAHSRYFYENERDGPHFIKTALRRAAGHQNDARATVYKTPKVNGDGNFKGDLTSLHRTVDASGGWWDAGDYLEFVQTTSYVVALMLDGIKQFPNQLGAGSKRSNLTGEAKFGLAWLMRMWDQRTKTLYYQVGIGAGNTSGTILSDHDIWRLPQADDHYGGSDPTFKYIRHRPVFEAAPAGSPISPNLAGRLAADFGLCYQVLRSSDRSLANRCLLDGETVFALAKTTHVGQLLTTIPYDFYPETNWQDDMELGATELASALADGGRAAPGLPSRRAGYYLGQAARWAKAYIRIGAHRYDALNLYDVSGLADYELDRAITRAGNPAGLPVTRRELVGNLRALIKIGTAQAKTTPFGYGAPWNSEDSVSRGDGLSVLASEYDALTASSTYAPEAQGWLDGVLGANPWGVSFIVGDGSTFPDCISSQVPNIVGNLHGRAPVLDGAAVEGPSNTGTTGFVQGMRACSVSYRVFNSRNGVFVDDEQSYNTDEPAIDLTASSFLAMSWLERSGR
jgi:endoglucanase